MRDGKPDALVSHLEIRSARHGRLPPFHTGFAVRPNGYGGPASLPRLVAEAQLSIWD
jgi:hypothetical protein